MTIYAKYLLWCPKKMLLACYLRRPIDMKFTIFSRIKFIHNYIGMIILMGRGVNYHLLLSSLSCNYIFKLNHGNLFLPLILHNPPPPNYLLLNCILYFHPMLLFSWGYNSYFPISPLEKQSLDYYRKTFKNFP